MNFVFTCSIFITSILISNEDFDIMSNKFQVKDIQTVNYDVNCEIINFLHLLVCC
jgi:hypothetical protein